MGWVVLKSALLIEIKHFVIVFSDIFLYFSDGRHGNVDKSNRRSKNG